MRRPRMHACTRMPAHACACAPADCASLPHAAIDPLPIGTNCLTERARAPGALPRCTCCCHASRTVQWTEGDVWRGSAELPVGQPVSLKYVQLDADGQLVAWEDGRNVSLTVAPSDELISGFQVNVDPPSCAGARAHAGVHARTRTRMCLRSSVSLCVRMQQGHAHYCARACAPQLPAPVKHTHARAHQLATAAAASTRQPLHPHARADPDRSARPFLAVRLDVANVLPRSASFFREARLAAAAGLPPEQAEDAAIDAALAEHGLLIRDDVLRKADARAAHSQAAQLAQEQQKQEGVRSDAKPAGGVGAGLSDGASLADAVAAGLMEAGEDETAAPGAGTQLACSSRQGWAIGPVYWCVLLQHAACSGAPEQAARAVVATACWQLTGCLLHVLPRLQAPARALSLPASGSLMVRGQIKHTTAPAAAAPAAATPAVAARRTSAHLTTRSRAPTAMPAPAAQQQQRQAPAPSLSQRRRC